MKHFFAALVLAGCLLLLTGTPSAEIVQFFDNDGNPAPARQLIPPDPSSRKFTVPEGIELRPDVRYESYPVFGRTFAEIVQSAEENGPYDRVSRKRSTSRFSWSLGWSYQLTYDIEYDDENEQLHCDMAISDVVFLYDLTIILPALTDDSALNPIEKDLWKNYVAGLVASEHGRVRIVKDDVRDSVLKRMGEISYLSLPADQADSAEQIIEQAVRNETARIGRETIQKIRKNLAGYGAPAPEKKTSRTKGGGKRR